MTAQCCVLGTGHVGIAGTQPPHHLFEQRLDEPLTVSSVGAGRLTLEAGGTGGDGYVHPDIVGGRSDDACNPR